MDAAEFFVKLRERGGNLILSDGAIRYRGHAMVLTPALRSYIARHSDSLSDYLHREQEADRRHWQASDPLAPYAALKKLAERDRLPAGTVGFSGQEMTLNAAVLHAWEWIRYLQGSRDDPFAEEFQADFLTVLERIQAYVSSFDLL